MVSSSGMPVSLKTDLRFPITGQQGHGSRNIQNAYYYWLRRARNAALEHTQTTFVELNVPTDEVVPQAPSMVHSFMPQLTIEKNGFVTALIPTRQRNF